MTGGRKRVAILALGGTIASARPMRDGVVPSLTAQDLAGAVPGLSSVADLDALTVRQVPSCDLTVTDIVALSQRITEAANTGMDGVVVTQGTDTMEETAFALDLLTAVDIPIVLTGAMRPPGTAGADGPANIMAAVRVASDATTRGLGVTVVLNDEMHAARFVRKTHTTSAATFRSDPMGALGFVTEDRVRILARPPRTEPVTVPYRPNAEVALLTIGAFESGRLVQAVAEAGFAGCVVQATGGGHVPSAVADQLGELASNMPVVLTSRTGGGAVLRHTYGFKGSEADLLGHGLIGAGALPSLKARVLLLLLVGAGAGKTEIRERFNLY